MIYLAIDSKLQCIKFGCAANFSPNDNLSMLKFFNFIVYPEDQIKNLIVKMLTANKYVLQNSDDEYYCENIEKLHKMYQIIIKNISNIGFCESCFDITTNKNFLCTICKKCSSRAAQQFLKYRFKPKE